MEQSATGEPQRAPMPEAADDGGIDLAGTPTLSLTTQHRGQETFINLSGELDLSSVPPLRELLARVFAEDDPRRVVLDLSDLIYLDSTGLSVFVTAHKRAVASSIEFCLTNPNKSVRRLFQITALDQVFVIVDAASPSGSPEASYDAPESEGPVDTD